MSDSTIQHQALALPEQPISHDVLLEKYAKGDERSADDVRARVARALAAVEAPAHARAVGGALLRRADAAASSRPGASTRPPARRSAPR